MGRRKESFYGLEIPSLTKLWLSEFESFSRRAALSGDVVLVGALFDVEAATAAAEAAFK